MSVKILSRFLFRLLPAACLCLTFSAQAQRYNFKHYELQDGLSQSQVFTISQDKAKQLWIASFGGIDSFDGKHFTPHTIADGLPSNQVYSVTCDNNGNIWWGSINTVTSFTEKGITNYAFQKKADVQAVGMIFCDSKNTIWAQASNKLYCLINGQMIRQQVVAQDEMVSSTGMDHDKNICVAIYNKGIYKHTDKGWELILPEKERFIRRFIFDAQAPADVIYITRNQILRGDIHHTEPLKIRGVDSNSFELISIYQDANKGLWLGTNKGAILAKEKTVLFFNESNGFTNTAIFNIFGDADNRIWFGTDGAGLFSYPNDGFLTFDKSQGLSNEVVMSFTHDVNGRIYIGTYGGSLLSYYNGKIESDPLPGESFSRKRINCQYYDKHNNLWIGTDDFGLWKRPAGSSKFIRVDRFKESNIYHITEDGQDNIWVSSRYGCFCLDNSKTGIQKIYSKNVTTLLKRGRDTMLMGTVHGILLVKNKHVDTNFNLKAVASDNILTIKDYKNFILIGSADRGLYIWNPANNQVQNITTREGLNSNSVYSIDVIRDELWLGTGRGVNRFTIQVEQNKLKLKTSYVMHLVTESNQDAIFHTDSSIWIGTTHGINIYRTGLTGYLPSIPNTVIQNISLLNTDTGPEIKYIYRNSYKLPADLSLPSNKSHISINFKAIQFADDDKDYYQYKLEGMDTSYSKPIQSNFVDYPSLPPGKYTFKVRAMNSAGMYKDAAMFSFEITPTFTQTASFKILLVILCLSAAYGAYVYKRYKDHQKLKYVEALKLKEQELVRRQTSEDFHDDLGNKLTRINMLSELLDKKINGNMPDEKALIRQIRASAAEMYSGTKNILWALNPDNDRLYEVDSIIEEFGEELFSNTDTSFQMLTDDKDIGNIHLPLGYSRNIILIFKELLHNILKHAEAETVTLAIKITSDRLITFTLTDDGKGFAQTKISEGAGIRNMQNRAKKIKGELITESEIGAGTTSRLIMPIPAMI